MYKELLTSLHGDTFVISLNRPGKLNAFTKTLQDELMRNEVKRMKMPSAE